MSKTAHKPNLSFAAFSVIFLFVLLLLVLPQPHLYAQALQKPGGHRFNALAAKKANAPFQTDLKKLLYLIRQDRWQEAGPFAYELAKRSPTVADAADANGLYALVLLRGGYPQEATEEAKQALGLDARSYWALVASGRVELWNGEDVQAKKSFLRAAQVHPQGAEARLGLCFCARPGSPDEAKATFAYLALSPTGHPHDQIVAGLKSFIIGHNLHRNASAKSFEADYSQTAHQVLNHHSPKDVQKSLVVIPLTSEDTGLFVTAVIDGHPMKLLLDTGADDITLTRQAAGRLSLAPQGTSTVSGVQGSEQSTDYLAKTLQLGPLRWTSIPLQTASIGHGDGVLGIDLLRHYVVCLDLAHHAMRLTTSAEAPLAGNSRQRLRFREYETKIMFPAQVGGQNV